MPKGSPSHKIVTIQPVTLIRSTPNAGLYRLEDKSEHWLPWDNVREGSADRDGQTGKVMIPRWLAEEKGIL